MLAAGQVRVERGRRGRADRRRAPACTSAAVNVLVIDPIRNCVSAGGQRGGSSAVRPCRRSRARRGVAAPDHARREPGGPPVRLVRWPPRGRRRASGGRGQRPVGGDAQPGGQVRSRPASTWPCTWNTLWPAPLAGVEHEPEARRARPPRPIVGRHAGQPASASGSAAASAADVAVVAAAARRARGSARSASRSRNASTSRPGAPTSAGISPATTLAEHAVRGGRALGARSRSHAVTLTTGAAAAWRAARRPRDRSTGGPACKPRKPAGDPASYARGPNWRADGSATRSGMTDPGGARLGADEAVTQLYAAHYRSLVRLGALLLRDTAAAEEVVQDSFVAMHGAWRRLQRPGPCAGLPAAVGGQPVPLRAAAPRGSDRHAPAPAPDAASAEHGAMVALEHAEVLAALRTAAGPPARGAGPALLRRPLRGRHRRHPRHQPRRRQEPRVTRHGRTPHGPGGDGMTFP